MSSDRHFAFLPVGSHGDVHPAVGLGVRMRQRGHRVTVITNGHFESLVRDAGLNFLANSTAEQYLAMADNPELWDRRRAFFAVARSLMDLARPTYSHLVRLHAKEGDRLTLVGTSLALAGRLAQEKLGVRLATIHLSPALFMSVYDPPRLPPAPPLRWAPQWLRRAVFAVGSRVVDNAIGPSLNKFRAELAMPPVTGIFNHWWHSPQLVLAMFPDWYCRVQPDWPDQAHNVGFPLFDERGITPLPEKLQAFLAEGPPPVAFTPGSAMFHAKDFFAASAEACHLAKLRGVLLTRKDNQVPATLPPGVIHIDYAPFSELLPCCAAVVHHGGIGSAAQALAAGTPQLIQPFAHDQPDNAARLIRLGVARSISPSRYKPRNVARALQILTTSERVRARAAALAARMAGEDAIGRACDLIDALAATPQPTGAVA